MYRYEKMLKKLEKIDGYEGYIIDMATIKRIIFKKSTSRFKYMLEIGDGAVFPPKIYKKDNDNKYARIKINQAEKDIIRYFDKIVQIMEIENENYQIILPFNKIKHEPFEYKVDNFLECIENNLEYIRTPHEIKVWYTIFKGEEVIGEIEYNFYNENKKGNYPIWQLRNYFIELENKKEKITKEIENNILSFSMTILEQLNKGNKLRKLFKKK